MKSIGPIWGVGGVLLLLSFAIYRLAPLAFDLVGVTLTSVQWAALVFSVIYMAYAEGYRGFHLGFAPRVVSRANYLHQHPRLQHVLLAPLFCMCYFHTTRKRQLMSIGLTAMIIVFVLIARSLPQPWRGIVDAGVVTGLTMGIISIFYFALLASRNPGAIVASAETPVSNSPEPVHE